MYIFLSFSNSAVVLWSNLILKCLFIYWAYEINDKVVCFEFHICSCHYSKWIKGREPKNIVLTFLLIILMINVLIFSGMTSLRRRRMALLQPQFVLITSTLACLKVSHQSMLLYQSYSMHTHCIALQNDFLDNLFALIFNPYANIYHFSNKCSNMT